MAKEIAGLTAKAGGFALSSFTAESLNALHEGLALSRDEQRLFKAALIERGAGELFDNCTERRVVEERKKSALVEYVAGRSKFKVGGNNVDRAHVVVQDLVSKWIAEVDQVGDYAPEDCIRPDERVFVLGVDTGGRHFTWGHTVFSVTNCNRSKRFHIWFMQEGFKETNENFHSVLKP